MLAGALLARMGTHVNVAVAMSVNLTMSVNMAMKVNVHHVFMNVNETMTVHVFMCIMYNRERGHGRQIEHGCGHVTAD